MPNPLLRLSRRARPLALYAAFLPSLMLPLAPLAPLLGAGRAAAEEPATPVTPAAAAPAAAAPDTAPDPRKDQGKGPWERVSTSDGILVERRSVPGSNLKEFRGHGVVEQSQPAVGRS